jgi:hypothetical protein
MYRDPSGAEFAVCVPTTAGHDGCTQTLHDSKIVHSAVRPTLFCLEV